MYSDAQLILFATKIGVIKCEAALVNNSFFLQKGRIKTTFYAAMMFTNSQTNICANIR